MNMTQRILTVSKAENTQPTYMEPQESVFQHVPEEAMYNHELQAKKHGGFENYREHMGSKLKSLLTGVRVMTRTNDEALLKILRDKRFKTMFETNRTRGLSQSKDRRLEVDKKVWGFPDDPAHLPEQRPVYGFLWHHDKPLPFAIHRGLGKYGADEEGNSRGIDVVLKPHVHKRTTFTFGDSLANYNPNTGTMGMIPSPMEKPDVFAYHPLHNDPTGLDALPEDTYTEAQVHGGVDTSDIDHVILRHSHLLDNTDLIKELGAHKIPYKVEEVPYPFPRRPIRKSVGGFESPPLKFSYKNLGGGFHEIQAHDPEFNPVGMLRFSAHPTSNHAQVEHIEVPRPERGKGYGRAIYQHFVDILPHYPATRHVETVGGEATSQGIYKLAKEVLGTPIDLSDDIRPLTEDDVYTRLPLNSPLDDEGVGQHERIYHTHNVPRAYLKSVGEPQPPVPASVLEDASHGGTGRWNASLVAPHKEGQTHWLYRDGTVSGDIRQTGTLDHTLSAHNSLSSGGVKSQDPLLDFISKTQAIPLNGRGDSVRALLTQKPTDAQKSALLKILQHSDNPALSYDIVHPAGYPLKNGVGFHNLSAEKFVGDTPDPLLTPPGDHEAPPYDVAKGREYEDGNSDFKIWCKDNGFADPEYTSEHYPKEYRQSLYNWLHATHKLGEM